MSHKIALFLLASFLLAAPASRAAPLTPEQQASHVLNRLAYGPGPGDIARVAQMGVQRYIDTQLGAEPPAYPAGLTERLNGLDAPNRSAGAVLAEFEQLRRDAKSGDPQAVARRRAGYARIVQDTARARLLRAIDSPRQLEEVMVDFWYNHFNVFAGKGIARALVASYERDAIRPYVFGSFRDLLGATAKHPAMLVYLDNHLSSGAASPPRANGRARGLNENYARELMELHTLGVDGGYTQKDVTELARMLTGWTFNPRQLMRNNQAFRFDPRRHDSGSKTWLGREVAPQGQREGEFALDLLAVHPATARHLSYKLAQYFVRDEPPPALVERMARAWIDGGGAIRPVLRTLFASEEFMAPASVGAKFKTPYQFVVSAVRTGAAPAPNPALLLGAMTQLGMPLYGCQTPDGYKNTQAAWLNPDALSRRIGFASALAGEAGPGALEATLGPAISKRTRELVADSPARLRAAMLLGSPDFMQR